MANDDGPTTREEWLENNRNVMVAEGADEDAVFYNQIETRLKAPWNPQVLPELQDEADERLGIAYTACLAQYEAEHDGDVGWSPLSVRHLVDHEKITVDEAGVLVTMTAREYGYRPENHFLITTFMRFLNDNTDTFDYTMVELVLEGQEGHPHCNVEHPRSTLKFTDEDFEMLSKDFISLVEHPCTTCGEVLCHHPLRTI